jgi:tetratricopeptide (TPR) repeat protein
MNILQSKLTSKAGSSKYIRAGISFVFIFLLITATSAGQESKSHLEAMRLASSLFRAGNETAAIETLDSYLQKNPDDLAARVAKARFLSFERRFPEAAREFETVLATDEHNIPAQLGLAKVRSWEGDFATALELYDQILATSPLFYDARVGKGFTLMWMGQHPQAAEILRWALRVRPGDTEVRQALVTISAAAANSSRYDERRKAVSEHDSMPSARRSQKTFVSAPKVSSFPEPIAPAAALPSENRFPWFAALSVSSIGILMGGAMVFLWRTHHVPTRKLLDPIQAPSTPLEPPRPRILILESNRSVQEFERSVLVSAGMDVVCVENAQDARQQLERATFAMVILDSNASGDMSFLELQDWMRSHTPALRGSLVITASSLDDAERLRQNLRCKVLPKPLKMLDLLRTLPDHGRSGRPAMSLQPTRYNYGLHNEVHL